MERIFNIKIEEFKKVAEKCNLDKNIIIKEEIIKPKKCNDINDEIIDIKENIILNIDETVKDDNNKLTIPITIENETEEPVIIDESDDESTDENYINCIKCKAFIPDVIKDKLCCRCNSTDEYWD